jgi:predicted transcriptional regulator
MSIGDQNRTEGMSTVRRTLDLDPDIDARIEALAAEKGKDAAEVVADAIELLDSIIDVEGPDVEEDLRRVREFERTGEAIPGEEIKAWIESWGTDNELPRPKPRKLR